MIQQALINELANNCESNRKTLQELFKAYDLACLGYDMQDQREKEICNEVLNNNVFTSDKDYDRAGIKAGDRITDEQNAWMLSEDDFKRCWALASVRLAEEGITNMAGYYLTDWVKIRGNARRELVNFIIDTMIPETLRTQFEDARLNITYSNQLIDIFRNIAA